jgi:glycosyltransferase involved in cell wall biosynthesis
VRRSRLHRKARKRTGLKARKHKVVHRSNHEMRSSGAPVVSVIIPAMNEHKTIGRVIRNAFQVHPQTEVIVVVNGSSDGTQRIAASSGARLIVHARPLGHDVGRSIGTREAKGEILLFLDADIVIPAQDLKPLIAAVREGTDVALNKYEGPKNKFNVHSVILAKHALNIALRRADLGGASMTTIPHAISRKALDTIGAQMLCIPPKAQAAAVIAGLNVRAVHYIDVGRPNPIKRKHVRRADPLESLIVGDHIEAFDSLIAATGSRGRHPDLLRNRSMAR